MKRMGVITDGNCTKLAVVCHNLDDDGTFGHIGKMYRFDDVKAVIKKDCYDEADIHYFIKNRIEKSNKNQFFFLASTCHCFLGLLGRSSTVGQSTSVNSVVRLPT